MPLGPGIGNGSIIPRDIITVIRDCFLVGWGCRCAVKSIDIGLRCGLRSCFESFRSGLYFAEIIRPCVRVAVGGLLCIILHDLCHAVILDRIIFRSEHSIQPGPLNTEARSDK